MWPAASRVQPLSVVLKVQSLPSGRPLTRRPKRNSILAALRNGEKLRERTACVVSFQERWTGEVLVRPDRPAHLSRE